MFCCPGCWMLGKITIHQRCQIKGVVSNLRMRCYSCRAISNALTSPLLSCSFLFSSFSSHIIPVADVSDSLQGVVVMIDSFLNAMQFFFLSTFKCKKSCRRSPSDYSHRLVVAHMRSKPIMSAFFRLAHSTRLSHICNSSRLHLLLQNTPPLQRKRCDERKALSGPDERQCDLSAAVPAGCRGRLLGSQEGVNRLYLKLPCWKMHHVCLMNSQCRRCELTSHFCGVICTIILIFVWRILQDWTTS